MRDYKFTVLFSNGDTKVIYAFSLFQAYIKATKEQIDSAKDCSIEYIQNEKGKKFALNTYPTFKELKN